MDYTHPEYLIDVDTLHSRLDDPNLRLFDAAVFLKPQASGGYQVDSGRDSYEQAHIPDAAFIDLVGAWADTSSALNFTLPGTAELASAIGASGIAADHDVVLYSSGHIMWATRAWWLLHYAGHNRVAVLNGSFNAWQAKGLPTESGTNSYPAAQFSAPPRPRGFADTAEVESGMHGKVCTVNALSPALYEGTGEFYYKRRGHIPGSRPLFYDHILEQEHFLPAQQLADALEAQGMLSADRVITYCGGGIAATVDAFACKLMGQDNAAVYDGSMSEWVQDDARPLTEGAQP